MGQDTKLLIFAANKFFEFNNSERDYNVFIYDGETIYDRLRKGYARVLPINKNAFRLIDYLDSKYWTVYRKDNNTIECLDEDKAEPTTFTFA